MSASRSPKTERSQSREHDANAERSPQEVVQRLRSENERLQRELREAKKKIADLERQLAMRLQNSTTSSKPPSSDGLSGSPRQRGRRKKSKRKPGGQLGHEGRNRPLVPGDRVDRVVKLYPEQCCGCGRNLAK